MISVSQLRMRRLKSNELDECDMILVRISIIILKWSRVGAFVKMAELSEPLFLVENNAELTMKCSCLF